MKILTSIKKAHHTTRYVGKYQTSIKTAFGRKAHYTAKGIDFFLRPLGQGKCEIQIPNHNLILDPKTFLLHTAGRFFSVGFIKRTNGEYRVMNARIGVKKGVKGAGRSWDPEEKGLIQVWDRGKKDFRFIPIEGILWIKFSKTYLTF